eukprot:gene28239-34975_t
MSRKREDSANVEVSGIFSQRVRASGRDAACDKVEVFAGAALFDIQMADKPPTRVGQEHPVTVAVRCRPRSREESVTSRPQNATATYVPAVGGKVVVQTEGRHATEETTEVAFDYCYGEDVKTQQIFQDLGQPVLDNALRFINGTIFAYGQTGSGKTHSMLGSPEEDGIIPLLCKELFQRLSVVAASRDQACPVRLAVRCSYVEVYQEQLTDLLVAKGKESGPHNFKPLKIRDHPQNAEEPEVKTYQEILNMIHAGNRRRVVAAHAMNERSSRSHAIFTIRLLEITTARAGNVSVPAVRRWSKINLVDLAGTERQKDTQARGIRLQESSNINKSLMTLQNVILTLLHNKEHPSHKKVVAYRESKLTQLLRESLGGNACCCMLATVSPTHNCAPQSVLTLKYAAAASKLKFRVNQNA